MIQIYDGQFDAERCHLRDFLESKSIADLIAEQNVKPVRDISELRGIWPEHEPAESCPGER